ncbi:MAG: Gfo/Idh/MocA family oxidoreductase, partial [bacterium]
MNTNLSRRNFLRTAAAASVFSIVPRHVLGGPGYTPPSEQLTKAVIGVGGMGTYHLGLGDTKLLAVCDVDEARLKTAMQRGGPNVKGYKDFREVLARPDIDIIHIPTPPHWHALISIAAAEAGKDIWCEKPMSRTIGESRRVRDVVLKHDRMFRLNTWFRFEKNLYGMNVPTKPIKKAVMNGLLGWPLKVTIGAHQGFDWKLGEWQGKTHLTPEPVPAGFDYDFWLGPAPFKPYSQHRARNTFRGYWDYDGGGRCFGVTGWGTHSYDQINRAMGTDETGPVEVLLEEPVQMMATGKYAPELRTGGLVAQDDTGTDYHRMAKLEGPRAKVTMKFANGAELKLHLDGDRGPGLGAIFVGEK